MAWRLAAVLAACLALLAVRLTEDSPQPAVQAPPPPAAPSAPAVQPTPGGQLERLIEFCSTLVTQERSFVVFSNGTCVIVEEPTGDPIGQALATLKDCSGPAAPFLTKRVEHDNYLVTYQKAAFHCLFFDEIAETRDVIESGFRRYLAEEEVASRPTDWEPPFHAKLGLVGRSRLNADARAPKVAKIIKARSLPSESATHRPPVEEDAG